MKIGRSANTAVALVSLMSVLVGCSSSREGALVATSNAPLACATKLGETLTNVRTWLGIASDGSQDSTVRVVDLTAAKAASSYLMSDGKDLVCGSPYSDQFDVKTPAGSEAYFVRQGDVVLGGGGNDALSYVVGGMFRGGAGNDYVQALNVGTFDGGAGNDEISDGFPAGTFLGGDGDDNAWSMAGGTFDGGAGTDAAEGYSQGTLTNVETCRTYSSAACP